MEIVGPEPGHAPHQQADRLRHDDPRASGRATPGHRCSASDVAAGTRLALPTVQKLLKLLARASWCICPRAPTAATSWPGHRPAFQPRRFSMCWKVRSRSPSAAPRTAAANSKHGCPVGGAWQKINRGIRGALGDITLADLAHPPTGISARGPLRPRWRTGTGCRSGRG